MSNFYNDASWLLIPSGIEEDIVFAQKPISGLGDLTFTRASDATYTDSTGVVRRSPYNLLTFSEDFFNVAWSKLATSIGSNVTTAPNGTLTADKLIEDTTNATHATFQITSILSASNYNYSVYLKAAERFRFRIRFTGFSGAQDSNVDLNAGTASAGTLTSVGNGWFRLTWSVNSGTGAVATNVSISLQDASGNTNYLGNGTSGAFIWGAQLVEGTSALDYFPTTNRQDVPRIDFRNADGTLSSCGRLLLEPQRTNSIRNSSMVGAVAGTPGTTPTNWSNLILSGLNRTVVGLGTENGLPYIDLRFNGTASGTAVRVDFESSLFIAASNGQTWTQSFYAKIISAPNPPLDYNNYMIERTSVGGVVAAGTQIISPTSTLQRFPFTRTLSGGATVGVIQPTVQFNLTNGATYDFTIRIAAPQMELGAYATTWVPTTTAAVTRVADNASKTGVSSLIGQTEGTLFVDINTQARASYTYSAIYTSSSSFIGIATSNTFVQMDVVVSGVVQASIRLNNSENRQFKMAAAYKANDFVFYVNGNQVGTDTSGSLPSMNSITLFDSSLGNANALYYNQAALFPTRLTNAQCIQLTTL